MIERVALRLPAILMVFDPLGPPLARQPFKHIAVAAYAIEPVDDVASIELARWILKALGFSQIELAANARPRRPPPEPRRRAPPTTSAARRATTGSVQRRDRKGLAGQSWTHHPFRAECRFSRQNDLRRPPKGRRSAQGDCNANGTGRASPAGIRLYCVPRRRGSRASRKPSPRKLKANMVMASASAGKITWLG